MDEHSRPPVASQRTFLGEPAALGYLSFTEAWERFSYYGMTALLVLYISQQLLLPGHVEHVAGFAAFRAVLERVFGPMSNLALASQVLGLYTGLVYFTPALGGVVADRWIGRRNAVVLGAGLMSTGHIAMAFDVSFLAALALLIIGCGLLKGNISAQVGELYAEADGPGRTRGFSIYSMGINVGAVTGPLGCGIVAQYFGWHAGFGLAGLLMILGLVTYLAGYKLLTQETPRSAHRTTPMTALEWRAIAALVVVMMLTVPHSIAYYQNTNINLVWIDRYVNLDLLGFHIPTAWFASIDPFVSILAVAPLFALWRWQDSHDGEPNEIVKIATGAFIACAANLILVAGIWGLNPVPAWVPLAYDILLGVAFLYYWPTLLALVSRAAPQGLKSTLMGCAFLSLFLGNVSLGWLGSFYEHMTPAQFWALHAAIAAAGGSLALLLNRPLIGMLEAPK
jgi:POT family proton-dependent oligopeptide transporter